QLARHVLDLAIGELLGELVLVDVGVHAVRAQQEPVAGQDVEVEGVDLDRAVYPHGAGHRVLVLLVGGALDLLAVELAAADQLVHQRVVLGQDVALVLAREVDPAVADVGDEAAQVVAAAGDEQHGGGGAHAALVGLGLGARVDRAARRLDRVLEDLEDLVALHARVIDAIAIDQIAAVVDRVADLVDRDRRRDLAG